MRPSASIAARTSPPVRKTRTRPPKRSPPPANSSTPKHAATMCSPKSKQRPKSNGSLHRTVQARPDQAGLAILSGALKHRDRSDAVAAGFQSGMGLGWGLFLLVARTQRSKSAASRGPLYFAWGCFRDFLSSEQIDRTKTHLALEWSHDPDARDERHDPAKNCSLSIIRCYRRHGV